MSEYENNGREAERKERWLQERGDLLSLEAEMVKVDPGGNDTCPHILTVILCLLYTEVSTMVHSTFTALTPRFRCEWPVPIACSCQ